MIAEDPIFRGGTELPAFASLGLDHQFARRSPPPAYGEAGDPSKDKIVGGWVHSDW